MVAGRGWLGEKGKRERATEVKEGGQERMKPMGLEKWRPNERPPGYRGQGGVCDWGLGMMEAFLGTDARKATAREGREGAGEREAEREGEGRRGRGQGQKREGEGDRGGRAREGGWETGRQGEGKGDLEIVSSQMIDDLRSKHKC
jgi:hypothetical protein